MPVRTRYSLKVQISSQAEPEDKDLGNLSYEVVDDQLGEGGTRKFTLAAGAVNTVLAMGNVATAAIVAIRTNPKDPLDTPSVINVRRNLITAEEIAILPVGNAKEGHFLLSTTGLTALFASNPGTVAMELTLVVCGD